MEWGFRSGEILLDKYRVEDVLGHGGMGVVLKVTHLQLRDELAVKILSPNAACGPDMQARFLQEAQSAVRLRGEHVPRVSDVGVLPDGLPYMVMEYLRGVDLSAQLACRRTLSPSETVDYVLQVCEALAEAHALGIIHRDIKPSNLFLTSRPDGTPLVKVLDFGISKTPVRDPEVLTRTNAVMGTPGYMSPEQMKASKDVDVRTDVWALGIVLYECLNGRRPFDAESVPAIVLLAATEPPPAMEPEVPRGLQAVVLRCLEKERAARFQSMAELAVALAPFASDQRAAATVVERTRVLLRGRSSAIAPAIPVGPRPRSTTLSRSAGMLPQRSTRRRYASVGAVLLLGALATGSVLMLTGPSDPTAPAHAARPAGSTHDLVAAADRHDAASGQRTDPGRGIATTPATGRAESEDVKTRAAACAELGRARNWQGLRDCAGEVARLGANDEASLDKAEELRVQAARESAAEVAAARVQQALREGKLREARMQLTLIGPDSVYWPGVNAAFQAAEAHAIEEDRRNPGSHPATSATVDSPCHGMDVDDVLSRATEEYTAGFARAALQRLTRALACKQDVRMYRMAGVYACAAHDVSSARAYYDKASAPFQPVIKQRCEQEGITLP